MLSLLVLIIGPLAIVTGAAVLARSAVATRAGGDPLPVATRVGAALILLAGIGLVVVAVLYDL